jgi:hypothetical protein
VSSKNPTAAATASSPDAGAGVARGLGLEVVEPVVATVDVVAAVVLVEGPDEMPPGAHATSTARTVITMASR